jgi:hypothetical protein
MPPPPDFIMVIAGDVGDEPMFAEVNAAFATASTSPPHASLTSAAPWAAREGSTTTPELLHSPVGLGPPISPLLGALWYSPSMRPCLLPLLAMYMHCSQHIPVEVMHTYPLFSGSDVNSFCCYGLVYLLDSW